MKAEREAASFRERRSHAITPEERRRLIRALGRDPRREQLRRRRIRLQGRRQSLDRFAEEWLRLETEVEASPSASADVTEDEPFQVAAGSGSQ